MPRRQLHVEADVVGIRGIDTGGCHQSRDSRAQPAERVGHPDDFHGFKAHQPVPSSLMPTDWMYMPMAVLFKQNIGERHHDYSY